MKTRRLITHFRFDESTRQETTLGPGARIDSTRGVLTLTSSKGIFPTDDDIQARTRLWQPTSLRRLTGFQTVAQHPIIDGQQPTRFGFRLSDGVVDYHWSGSAWVEPTPTIDGQWSTEEEVAENIGVFLSTTGTRALQIVVNIETDDRRVAPSLFDLKVLWDSDIEAQEDIILRSLVPDLKAKLRPRADSTLVLAAAATTFTVANLALETPYDVVAIDSVFDETADPTHFDDLLLSYNSGTKTATLTAPWISGHRAWVRFLYRPTVAVTTSQDYDEVASVPAVIIRDIETKVGSELPQSDGIVNRSTGAAVRLPAPIQGDLELRIEWHTDKQVDHQRLADEMKRYFGSTRLLRSRGLDEDFRLWLLDEYASAFPADADNADLLRGELVARIVGVLSYHRDAVDETAVLAFKTTRDSLEEIVIVAAQRVFWGAKVPTGPFNAAFITSLSDFAFSRTAARVIDMTASATEKLFFAFPSAFGTPRFRVNGLEGGFFRCVTGVSVDGVFYDVVESDALGLGPTRLVAT